MEYVEVYIDEAPFIGGNEALLIEVYENGRQVRLYTHAFMERMALRPMPLHRVW